MFNLSSGSIGDGDADVGDGVAQPRSWVKKSTISLGFTYCEYVCDPLGANRIREDSARSMVTSLAKGVRAMVERMR